MWSKTPFFTPRDYDFPVLKGQGQPHIMGILQVGFVPPVEHSDVHVLFAQDFLHKGALAEKGLVCIRTGTASATINVCLH